MKIRRAKAVDLPKITHLCATAFLEEKLSSWLFPRRHEYFHDYRREFGREINSHFYSPGHVVWVAETEQDDSNPSEDDQIVGFAIWERHGTSAAASAWQDDSFSKSPSPPLNPSLQVDEN